MKKEHLDKLIEIGEESIGYVGNNSLKWAASVWPDSLVVDKGLDKRFDRYSLAIYCDNVSNDDVNVVLAILSWGGMKREHGRALCKDFDSLLPLVRSLRKRGFMTRGEAFDVFHKIRKGGNLQGLGIAYFTKLICFLAPELNGYIMDQWTAKSVNLLTGKNLVSLTGDWVNNQNSAHVYEQFCQQIDHLAVIMGCSGLDAEKRIFSLGRGKGQWRNYLKSNYRK